MLEFNRFGKWALLSIILLLVMLVGGCGGLNSSKSIGDMSTMERSVFMLTTYNAQYADYMSVTGYTKIDGIWVKTSDPVLSEDTKKILQKKKKILVRVKPLIKIYTVFAEGGLTPDEATEQEILALLVDLAGI